MTMSEYEDAIKRFLRKISPEREWRYIGEVEHAWMGELYDELTSEFNDENAKLRESVRNLLICIKHVECDESCPNYEPMYTDYGYEKNGSTVVESEYLGCCTVGLENCNSMLFDTDEYLRELGIEVGE